MKGTVEANKIHLHFVKTLRSSIDIGNDFVNHDGREFDLAFGNDTGINLDAKKIIFTFNILIEFKNENIENSAKASFDIQYLFEVDNLDELSNVHEDGTPIVDGSLTLTLAGIAYSTSRGLVYNLTDQSLLGGIIIPVVDPMSLLKPEDEAK